MATNNEVIRVEHVVKEFDGGVRALDDCSLTVRKGEVVAIIGPSGSGKSTMLRCLNLLEQPTSGKVYVDDVDITAKGVDLENSNATTAFLELRGNEFIKHIRIGKESGRWPSAFFQVIHEIGLNNINYSSIGLSSEGKNFIQALIF